MMVDGDPYAALYSPHPPIAVLRAPFAVAFLPLLDDSWLLIHAPCEPLAPPFPAHLLNGCGSPVSSGVLKLKLDGERCSVNGERRDVPMALSDVALVHHHFSSIAGCIVEAADDDAVHCRCLVT